MTRSLVLMILIVSGGIDGGLAAEREFSEVNCAITLPEGWSEGADGQLAYDFSRWFSAPDGSGFIALVVDKRRVLKGPMDERFVAAVDKLFGEIFPGKCPPGRSIEIAGRLGYERAGNLVLEGKALSVLVQSVFADGNVIFVVGGQNAGTTIENAPLRAAMASFRFLKPPGE